jgi:type IV secretory pathway VirB2 component (pilin)
MKRSVMSCISRLVGWLFGHNLKQALCIVGIMVLSFQIARGGHGFDLLCCFVLSELCKTFSPNRENTRKF